MNRFLLVLLSLAITAQSATVFTFTKRVDGTPTFLPVTAANSSLFGLDGSGALVMVPNSTFGNLTGGNSWIGDQGVTGTLSANLGVFDDLSVVDGTMTFDTLLYTYGTGAAAAHRTALGLVIGTHVQAYDADLTTWAGITPGLNVPAALALDIGAAGAVQLNNGSGAGLTALNGSEITSGTVAAARVAIDGQTSTVTMIPVTYSNSSDFTTTSTTFVDATGLSFPVLANKNYKVEFNFVTSKTDASGLQIQFTGPASPTKLLMRYFGTTSALSSTTTPDIDTAFSQASTTMNTVNGDGYILASYFSLSNGANAGTVQLQIRAVTGGTAKIYAGSWIQVTQLN